MPVSFVFGVHSHQPLGNFDEVVASAVRLAYRPFFETLRRFPAVRAVVHTSGLLLEWWEAHAPDLLALVAELAARGQIEPLTGGLTEPILPLLPDHDKIGQVRALTAWIERRLGVRPRGMWLAERVWEPHLAKPLAEAGVEYVLVDDHHFGLAGLDPGRLAGYYLTEEQGHTLAVFPISQRLRYLIPFQPVERALAELATRAGAGGGLTMVDDAEKFGVWPGTHRSVYEEGWLESFFDALSRSGTVDTVTARDYLDRHPPTGRVYLPAASYREMGEWALDPGAGAELARAQSDLARVAGEPATRLLRGGFWRNFLVRYPEVNDAYRKMLRLSAAIDAGLALSPGEPGLLAARTALWRGQCNDAYWHGIFGGVYLPHLRRAVRAALLEAEALLDAGDGGGGVARETADLDGDGAPEIRLRSSLLGLLLRPAQGGTLTELAYRPLRLDLADVLTRRPEHSHCRLEAVASPAAPDGRPRTIHEGFRVKEAGLERLLAYDPYRRASLQDLVCPPYDPLHQRAPTPWIDFPRHRCQAQLVDRGDVVAVELRARAAPGGVAVALGKTLELSARAAQLDVRYELRASRPVTGRFLVRWNLTLTGPAADRYYLLESGERRSLESTNARGAAGVALVDAWLGLTAALRWSAGGVVAWEPVYTVSLSEEGLERIWQGVEVTVSWPVELHPDPWTAWLRLALEPHGPPLGAAAHGGAGPP